MNPTSAANYVLRGTPVHQCPQDTCVRNDCSASPDELCSRTSVKPPDRHLGRHGIRGTPLATDRDISTRHHGSRTLVGHQLSRHPRRQDTDPLPRLLRQPAGLRARRVQAPPGLDHQLRLGVSHCQGRFTIASRHVERTYTPFPSIDNFTNSRHDISDETANSYDECALGI